jgi:glycosyltransferase involved in cell wall biosynthesis
MKKIRIVFILPSAELGGAERVVFYLINHLSRNRFKILLILLKSSGSLMDSIPSDVSMIDVGGKKVSIAVGRIIKTVRVLKPDIIFSTHAHLSIAILVFKAFLPKVTRIIIRESNVPSQKLNEGAKSALIRILYRFTYPRAHAIVCPGKAIRDDLLKTASLDSQTLVEIPNPVDTQTIKKKMVVPLDEEFEHGENLVAAGSLTRQKGFDLLIDAIAILSHRRKNIRLVILGDGVERKNLVQQISRHRLNDHVQLTGVVKNVYPYFYHADVFVLSSRWEGMPNVVLEALACGTPVVTFDCPGCVNEIIENSGQGILVNPENPTLLAEAIDRILEHRKTSTKESLLSTRFSLDTVIREYEGLFTQVTSYIEKNHGCIHQSEKPR